MQLTDQSPALDALIREMDARVVERQRRRG